VRRLQPLRLAIWAIELPNSFAADDAWDKPLASSSVAAATRSDKESPLSSFVDFRRRDPNGPAGRAGGGGGAAFLSFPPAIFDVFTRAMPNQK
jgi:hypothetical protein